VVGDAQIGGGSGDGDATLVVQPVVIWADQHQIARKSAIYPHKVAPITDADCTPHRRGSTPAGKRAAQPWQIAQREDKRGAGNSHTPPYLVTYIRAAVAAAVAARSLIALALESQTGGGSIRLIVLMRSMDRSKEATLLIPVVSAQATRYASAKSIRSVS
jgi:hypothetical protein